ncbi:ParB/RepB/Spo0J family partition protein [Enterobacter hormaechei]|uniref:ParB/RepB/Spo0J family partition protein n=1 Tax=Enterobacter hormaechei TaxID=158836 RepID=UPI000793FAC5|nr:ParB/RepB/Spo0J family partition protein [Enterobacter hormaechei]SAI45494.1 nuclease [Enterobacter hormaechei]
MLNNTVSTTSNINTVSSTVPYKKLRQTSLNARKHNVDTLNFKRGIISLARSIAARNLLQNLIVFSDDEVEQGCWFVAAGQRRLMALDYLHRVGAIDDDYPVRVDFIDKADALVVSVSENNDRVDMHLSDLIVSVNELANNGDSVEVIAAKFGYKAYYVRKLMKLANMAPELMQLLKNNKISLNQLIALSITDDHDLQLKAWENCSYDKNPKDLRRLALNEEEPVSDNKYIKVVGIDAYRDAGGEIKHDLFTQHESHGGYILNPSLVQELALNKLQVIAEQIANSEGWGWYGSQERLESWGDDSKRYEFPRPQIEDYLFTKEQQIQLDSIFDKLETVQFAIEEADEFEGEKKWEALRPLRSEHSSLEKQKSAILDSADFTQEYKSQRGVIVSIGYHGDIVITRGLMKLVDKASKENKAVKVNTDGTVVPVTQVSAALARSLSCERTLAVQAALLQKPEIALALTVQKLALSVFSAGYHQNPACFTIQETTRTMIEAAPGCEEGEAVKQLRLAKAKWSESLPKGWEDDFTLLTSLGTDQLLELQAFCVAATLDGSVSQYEPKQKSKLHKLEFAMNFDIHEYWKPTAQNLWSRLKKEGMIDQLTQAGVSVNKDEFMAYKKGDAAKRAEQLIEGIKWVPDFM